MIWKTFKEWSSEGYWIVKGSKGVKTPVGFKFSERQVRLKKGNSFNSFIGHNGIKSAFYGDQFDGGEIPF